MNPYRRDLLEFKFKNQLVTTEEMEAVMEVNKQMTEKALAANRSANALRIEKFAEDLRQQFPKGLVLTLAWLQKTATLPYEKV